MASRFLPQKEQVILLSAVFFATLKLLHKTKKVYMIHNATKLQSEGVLPRRAWRGLWPQPNSKYEYRNTKQIQMTKNPMLQTLRNPHLINALRLCILKNEVDG